MDNNRELDHLRSHLVDLARRSEEQNIFTFSGFLGLAEQDILQGLIREGEIRKVSFWGGLDKTERVMARFGDFEELGYEQEYPIRCLWIRPTAPKFAEQLGHRDYLGALMNLGIKRELLGDILIHEKDAYLFCIEDIAEYISGLDRVRHTGVKVSFIAPEELEVDELFRTEAVRLSVMSPRIDAVVAKLYNISRSQSSLLLEQGKLYINGRNCVDSGVKLREGDIISVRGYGRFLYRGTENMTKKGKTVILIEVYV